MDSLQLTATTGAPGPRAAAGNTANCRLHAAN